MDESTYSNLSVKGNGSDPNRSRFERLLGVPGAEREAAPLALQPSKQCSHESQRGSSRLERLLGVSSPGGATARPAPSLGVSSPGGAIARPAPSLSAGPLSRDAHHAGVGTDPSKYAVHAVVALTVGVLGLGIWTFDLRGQVSSLKKAVAAESSADAAVTRQLAGTNAELDLIGARLNDVEGLDQDLSGIETRLADIERRLGRKR